MTPSQPLILLVGMHRSGTSLLGSLLPQLGVPMPGELIAGDEHNPEGYYERSDITDLQENLLIGLRRWWPSASGCDPLPPGWLDAAITRAAAADLRRLLAAEQRRQRGPWAIKDPRSSLLLPLWRQVAADLELPLRLVLSVRDPAEVMVSLLQRDSESAAMTAQRAQQLWWHHNRQLLLDAGELPLLVLSYGDWFEPRHRQRQLHQLSGFCLGHLAPASQLNAAATHIQPRHRRSRRNRRNLPRPIHPWVARLHSRLQQLAAAGSPPRQCTQLQRWLLPNERALPPEPAPGPWFQAEHYRSQQPHLSPLLPAWWHYQLLGWRRSRSPHPLFEANHYRHQAHLQGVATPGPALRHFLRNGLSQGLPPTALADPAWSQSTPHRLALTRQARLEGLHPWGSAALAVCRGQLLGAIHTLKHWLHHGLSATDREAILGAAAGQFNGEALAPTPNRPFPQRARLAVLGATGDSCSWQLHAWLQHLPLPAEFELHSTAAATIHLLLEPIPEGPDSLQLIPLAGQPWVFCNDPKAIPLLQRLGITAQLLEPHGAGNGWLARPNDAAEACRELGLPPARTLAAQAQVLCLGSAGPSWEHQLSGPVWCWPGFPEVKVDNPEAGRLLASWLNACNRSGVQLVRLQASPAEQALDGWRALQPPAEPPEGWLPPQHFQPPLQPQELLAELAWRAAGCPPPPPIHTPEPSHQVLWELQSNTAPQAAVCVSLYNYADQILRALESVRAQTFQPLELIVVDDGSSDTGPARVHQWFSEQGPHFCRALLVQHHGNGGLASARNTAFSLARAPWCFVLDADNTLEPAAVAACLALARSAPSEIAAVHPLVERVGMTHPAGSSPLISGLSWQRQHFLERNVVDAMALVRRSAWEHVGGYSHIPGGWEDYDFWCKLIEADFSGILCPQRLARYHCHASSMLATQTHHQLRAISRILQHRHPWLKLHLAAPCV